MVEFRTDRTRRDTRPFNISILGGRLSRLSFLVSLSRVTMMMMDLS
jgi:hypothetical protein